MLLPTCNLCRHWMGASTSDMAVEHPWESFADQQTAAVNTGTWHHMAICAWGNAPNSCSQSHVTYFRPIHQIYIARSAMIYPEKSSNISIRIRSLRPHFPVASCCMPPQIKGIPPCENMRVPVQRWVQHRCTGTPEVVGPQPTLGKPAKPGKHV